MILYVAGPYVAPTRAGIDANIEAAAAVAAALWTAGDIALCPHLNTAHFEERCPGISHEEFVRRDLVILARCDGAVFLPTWENSQGAQREWQFCQDHDIPVWYWPDFPVERGG